MFTFIDHILNKTTMYRVVMFGLNTLILWAIIASALRKLPFSILTLVVSLLVLLASAVATHYFLKSLFKAPANIESTVITAVILFFILQPSLNASALAGLALAGVIAIASKYFLAYKKAHLVNPAAFAAVILGIPLIAPATWWIGSATMFIPVLIVGCVIVRKTRRAELFLATVGASVITVLLYGATHGGSATTILSQHFLSWPILFFASIMVTEPLSTPPRRNQRIVYGALIGIFSSLPLHIGMIYSTPELTLVLANIIAFFFGLRARLSLPLIDSQKIAHETHEFTFKLPKAIHFLPGQYLEWALPHTGTDDRGIKRYFTISSSPTQDHLALGVKIPEKASSFKQALQNMKKDQLIHASQLVGDFTLPADPSTPLVFIAGGIGVTPFVSMIRYLLDKNETRDITLFYATNTPADFAYQELFTSAEKIGVKTVHVITDKTITDWDGEQGFIDAKMIESHVKTPSACKYYISGPPGMVDAYKSLLRKMGIRRTKIKTDYFPGYA